MAAALSAAGLIETLKGSGPFTVFAPTDDAFSKIPAESLSELLQPESSLRLVSSNSDLSRCQWEGVPARAIADTESATTLQGQTLQFSKQARSQS